MEIEFDGAAVAQEALEQSLKDIEEERTLTLDEVIAQMGRNPLPDGYISLSLAPNRKMRRLARQRTRRMRNHLETWTRTLLSYGINPEDVMLERREKRGRKPKPTPRTRTTTHSQRRKAARVRRREG